MVCKVVDDTKGCHGYGIFNELVENGLNQNIEFTANALDSWILMTVRAQYPS